MYYDGQIYEEEEEKQVENQDYDEEEEEEEDKPKISKENTKDMFANFFAQQANLYDEQA
jgi:hypothetical protein